MSLSLLRASRSRWPWLIFAGAAFVIFIANGVSSQASPPKPAPVHHAPPPVHHAPPPARYTPPAAQHHTPMATPNIPRINIVNPPLSGYTLPRGGYTPLPQTTNLLPAQPGVSYPPPQVRGNPLPPAKQPVTTALKPNLPPELSSPKSSLKPNYQLAAAAVSYDDLVAAFAAIQDEQQQKLDSIKDGLGPQMLADPTVAAAIDAIQSAIDNGEQISDGQIDDLINAVTTANNNGIPVTGGLDPFTAIQTLGELCTNNQVAYFV